MSCSGVSHKFRVFGEHDRMLDQLGAGANGERDLRRALRRRGLAAAAPPLHRASRATRRSPSASATSASSRRSTRARTRGAATPATTPTEPGRRRTRRRDTTFSRDLPAVWRPTGEQLPLWRAFYRDWDQLDCVAAPGDRSIALPDADRRCRRCLGRGRDRAADAARGRRAARPRGARHRPAAPRRARATAAAAARRAASPPSSGPTTTSGTPTAAVRVESAEPHGDPLVVVLATRNQAVDDATVDGRAPHRSAATCPRACSQASTVDSWQGQTNRITVAIHPLSGADQLDDFNSAFGRLAVTCTRATHGLLLVARAGLDDLLDDAPARPGTPFGEPGTRALPRQTHQRILASFARGTWDVSKPDQLVVSEGAASLHG